jgi:glucokinase
MGHRLVVLGIDYGGTKIATAVCDLAGTQLASTTVGSGGELGARASFERGVAAAKDLLTSAAPGSRLAAVGVSTFGIPFEDRVELAPAISGWDRLEIGRRVRAAFPGTPIRMATDAKAAAQAEARWGVLADCDPAVYLNLGTGLAAAIVVGGKVIYGCNGAAGEIGYNLRTISDVGRALDRRAPLEDVVSGQGLARRASDPAAGSSALADRRADREQTGTELTIQQRSGRQVTGQEQAGRERSGRRLTAADVFRAAADDPALDRMLDEFADELAYHVVNLAILVNPARIAVGGGIVRSWERIRPRLQHALSAGVPFPPELVVARFPHDAPLLGAVALALDAIPAADGHAANNHGAAGDLPDAADHAATDDRSPADGHPVTNNVITGQGADGARVTLNPGTINPGTLNPGTLNPGTINQGTKA